MTERLVLVGKWDATSDPPEGTWEISVGRPTVFGGTGLAQISATLLASFVEEMIHSPGLSLGQSWPAPGFGSWIVVTFQWLKNILDFPLLAFKGIYQNPITTGLCQFVPVALSKWK